ncbi:MAG TPA: hypothetical protein VD994_10585 [Prosthecobacter sp.]|nr:hypothetical protein [Prosthecobacter sp.]
MGRWLGHNSDAIAKAERGERRFSIADLIRISLELGCEVENLIGPPPK